MGLFFRGLPRPLTSSEGKSYCLSIQIHFGQCYAFTFWEQFGEGPFLFQNGCAPVHKGPKYIVE